LSPLGRYTPRRILYSRFPALEQDAGSLSGTSEMMKKMVLAIANDSHKDRAVVPMLADCASRMGAELFSIERGDARMLGADILIVVGDCRGFKDYCHSLETASKRPFTVLWQFEPLPAPVMAPELEPDLTSLARTDRFKSHDPEWGRAARIMTLANPAINLIRKARAGRLRKRIRATTDLDVSLLHEKQLSFLARNYDLIRRYRDKGLLDSVVVSVWSRKQFLDRVGIPSTFVPIGWHPMWGQDLHRTRDIDVVFLGGMDAHRRGILDGVRHIFEAKGIGFRVVESGCNGHERNELLSRTKILLDVPRLPWELPGMRLLTGMGCGAMVISAWSGDTAPYVAGRHLVCTSAGQLVPTVEHYLHNEDQRRQIARSGHDFVTQEHTIDKSLAQIMAIAQACRMEREASI
jgi:hypothetical protein